MSQYRKNRRRRLTGESCSVNNIGVYILFIIYEQGRVADETTNDFRCFILVLLIAGMLPWLLMKLVYGSRGFSELYQDFIGDPGMFFILCIPSAILLVAAKYFLL